MSSPQVSMVAKWQRINAGIKRTRYSGCLYDDKYLIFGGFGETKNRLNDLLEYNTKTNSWHQIKMHGKIPNRRTGHLCNVVGDDIYVIGGHDGTNYTNDVHRFSFLTKKWTLISPVGEMPVGRGYHSSITFENSICIFGGYSGIEDLNDIWLFLTKEEKWRPLKPTQQPPKRSSHSAIAYHSKMIIFGGDAGKSNPLGDTWMFDFIKNEWSIIHGIGDVPSKRFAHSSSIYKHYMFIIAGFDGVDELNDMFRLNLETQIWTNISCIAPPPKRSYHSSFCTSNGLYVLGGESGDSCTTMDGLFKIDLPSDWFVCTFDSKMMENMLKDQIFSDAIFKVKGTSFIVHSCILSQSPVFDELLSKANRDESNLLIVDLKDEFTSPQVFSKLLTYLYTGEIILNEKDSEIYIPLVVTGIHYKIPELEQICISQFDNVIRIQNILHILMESHEHNHNLLKTMCFNYFFQNKEEIMKTQDVNSLEKSLLEELVQVSKMQILPKMKRTYSGPHRSKNHIEKLYETKKYADITLVTNDLKEIRVHKCILCTSSEYFSLLLNSSFKERIEEHESGFLRVNVDSRVLFLVLEFIYKRPIKLPKDYLLLMDILRFCDMAMLTSLYDQVIQQLMEIISSTNVFEIFQFCSELNIEGRLKEKCWEIIRLFSKDDLVEIILEIQLRYHTQLMKQMNQLQQQFQEQIVTLKNEFKKEIENLKRNK